MEQTIKVESLKLPYVLRIIQDGMDLSDVDRITFDFKGMYKVEPLAMLLFSKFLRSLKDEYPKVQYLAINHDNDKNSYASHMGFFQSFGLDYGKLPGEASGSHTYIPITKLDIRDLRIESYESDGGVIQEVLVRKAEEIAHVLCGGNFDIKNSLFQCTREVLRNIVEHSESECIWIAAQRWNSHDAIEIGILDEGVGIKQTLTVNPHIRQQINDDSQALNFALQPAISGKAYIFNGQERGRIDGVWDHSGYGLYITSQISKENGKFFIASNDSALFINQKNEINMPYNQKGTAIGIKLSINELNKFKQEDIDEIIKKGQELAARKYGDFALTSASAASKKSLQR